MANPFDHLHIKGRTAGSSNELSFDVLDAAASSDAGTRRRTSRPGVGSLASRGSYHGVGGTSTLSAVPEVERRKRARRSRELRLRALGVVLLAVVVAGVAFSAYRFYESRVDFTGHFRALIGELTEVDQTLSVVDGLMRNPLGAVEADARAEALEGLPDVLRRLSALDGEVDAMSPETSGGVFDAGAIEDVREAARAREAMARAATEAFELSEKVNTQVSVAEEAWELMVDADGDVREATTRANAATTVEATEAARGLTARAYEELAEAKRLFAQVATEVRLPGLFGAYADYIEARMKALEFALATSDALLANDRAGAAAANESYNAADREAAELAEELPADAAALVAGLYEDEVDAVLEEYGAARTAATEADARLRGRLR